MAHPPFGVRGSHPLIASFQRAYPPFHDLRHVVVPLQDHETTPFKEVNLRVSRQYGRFGPAAGFLGIREFVQNCLDQAGRQAVGGVRDVQCEILKANLDTLYGFYSVRGDSLISHGHVLQVASPTKRGSFDYEICNYSTLRVTERSLDVGSSDKSGKDTIGCYGDGLLTSIALLTKKDVPVVLDTFNCR